MMDYDIDNLNKEVEEFQNRVTQFSKLIDKMDAVKDDFDEIKKEIIKINQQKQNLNDLELKINQKYEEIKNNQAASIDGMNEDIKNTINHKCKDIIDKVNSKIEVLEESLTVNLSDVKVVLDTINRNLNDINNELEINRKSNKQLFLFNITLMLLLAFLIGIQFIL